MTGLLDPEYLRYRSMFTTREGDPKMTRMKLALTLSAVLLAGASDLLASQTQQTTPPPQTQTPPLPSGKPAPPKPAEPAPFPPDAKFAFVNLQYVVSESKYGKEGSAELKKFSETKQAQLTGLEKEIEGLKSKLNSQRSLMTAEAQNNLNNQIQQLSRKFQFEGETAQQEIQRLNADLLTRFQDKVLPIIETIRKERGLHVIFAQQDEAGGLAVIAFDPGLDLSAEVVKRLDAVK
jgi:outer membrane protein